jgi:hypothetical protein
MLSGEALNLAFVLRETIGPLAQHTGPALDALKVAARLPDASFQAALAELESIGFVAIARAEGSEPSAIVLPPLQIYLDDLENQGTDDF